jgi:hypothetical protein
MDSVKYIGVYVHKEAISIAVLNSFGRMVMECVIETKASTILQFIQGLSGSLPCAKPESKLKRAGRNIRSLLLVWE